MNYLKKLWMTIAVLTILTATPVWASDLVTNLKESHAPKILEIAKENYPHDVYDVSFSAYDADFAEEFALHPDNVEEMDAGIRFMEIRMITEGQSTNCYYNVVLDKSVELDFPDEDYIANMQRPIPLFPKNYDAPVENRFKRKKLYAHNKFEMSEKYRNRLAIGNPGYKFNTSGKPFSDGIVGRLDMTYYIQSRDIAYNIIAAKGGCFLETPMQHPDFSFWVRKKGHEENTTLPKVENYHTFLIPSELLEKFEPTMLHYMAKEQELMEERAKIIRNEMIKSRQ